MGSNYSSVTCPIHETIYTRPGPNIRIMPGDSTFLDYSMYLEFTALRNRNKRIHRECDGHSNEAPIYYQCVHLCRMQSISREASAAGACTNKLLGIACGEEENMQIPDTYATKYDTMQEYTT